MTEYVDCRECNTECARADGNYGYTFCSCFKPKKKPTTNADRIRSMDDEELADFLAYTWATSARAWQKDPGETLHWLQQKAEDVNHE